MSEEKSPKWVRIVDIILGAIAIGLSGMVLANPDVTTVFFVTLLSIALIVVGVSRIIGGAAIPGLSKGGRAAGIAVGVLGIVGGAIALANPVLRYGKQTPSIVK